MTDLVAQSREVMATHAASFRFAAYFLPSSARDEAAVAYAFCRLVDDTVDEAVDPRAADDALFELRGELTGAKPARPLVARFRLMCEERGFGLDPALALLDGADSDNAARLSGVPDVALADDRALLRYAYRVAGTVGLMMCGVLGVREADALPHAVDLGVAMQITNICRDVAEDARRGRVYLPADRLRAAGVRPEQLLDGTADRQAVAAVVGDLLAVADRYYASGLAGARYIPWRARLAILVAGRVYRAIGTRLAQRGNDALAGRVWVPTSGKVAQALRAVWTGFVQSLRRPPRHDPALHRALAGLPGAHA